MEKKFLYSKKIRLTAAILAVTAAAFMVTGCGKHKEETTASSSFTSSESVATASSQPVSSSSDQEKTEKKPASSSSSQEADKNSDAEQTQSQRGSADMSWQSAAEPGATDTLEGEYYVEGKANLFYVFTSSGSVFSLRDGSYSMSGKKITLKVGASSVSYRVKKTDGGAYSLTGSGNRSLEMRFVSGADDLGNGAAFSGVYQVGSSSRAFTFRGDGTWTDSTRESGVVSGNEVTLAGRDYTWKPSKDGGSIELRANGGTALRLVPAV